MSKFINWHQSTIFTAIYVNLFWNNANEQINSIMEWQKLLWMVRRYVFLSSANIRRSPVFLTQKTISESTNELHLLCVRTNKKSRFLLMKKIIFVAGKWSENYKLEVLDTYVAASKGRLDFLKNARQYTVAPMRLANHECLVLYRDHDVHDQYRRAVASAAENWG